jgi:hypothetical protein
MRQEDFVASLRTMCIQGGPLVENSALTHLKPNPD